MKNLFSFLFLTLIFTSAWSQSVKTSVEIQKGDKTIAFKIKKGSVIKTIEVNGKVKKRDTILLDEYFRFDYEGSFTQLKDVQNLTISEIQSGLKIQRKRIRAMVKELDAIFDEKKRN